MFSLSLARVFLSCFLKVYEVNIYPPPFWGPEKGTYGRDRKDEISFSLVPLSTLWHSDLPLFLVETSAIIKEFPQAGTTQEKKLAKIPLSPPKPCSFGEGLRQDTGTLGGKKSPLLSLLLYFRKRTVYPSRFQDPPPATISCKNFVPRPLRFLSRGRRREVRPRSPPSG